MKIERAIVGPMYQVNCWIVGNDEKVVVIDPGDEPDKIINIIGDRKVEYILNTHLHIDHIGAVADLRKKYNAPFGIHKNEKPALHDAIKNLSAFTGGTVTLQEADMYFNDGDELDFLGQKIKVLHTPGHTEGGCCYVIGKNVFTGDTLFNMSIGRTDFPGGNTNTIINSIKKKLMPLGDDYKVYPGHMGESTIGFEKANNPFLK
jgi:glyoxylase-like metal-dependent hydrolase (beta-lactamase superfamily II)